MKHLEREIHRLCDDIRSHQYEIPIGLVAQADRIQDALRRSKRRPSPSSKLKGSTKAQDRTAKRVARRAEMAELRAAAVERARRHGNPSLPSSCVLGEVTREIVPVALAVLCHLNGGVGRRRETQHLGNVVIDTRAFNTESDEDPEKWLPHVKAWCARYGYPLPPRWVAIEAKADMNAGLAATAAKREG